MVPAVGCHVASEYVGPQGAMNAWQLLEVMNASEAKKESRARPQLLVRYCMHLSLGWSHLKTTPEWWTIEALEENMMEVEEVRVLVQEEVVEV